MDPTVANGGAIPTVVVVNDEVDNLQLLGELLSDDGKHVHLFETVADAVAALPDMAPPPDLIVTDLYMPGIDGWRFCRLLRGPEFAAFNQTPIFIVSATFSGSEADRITRELGANAFLHLGTDSTEFVTTVNNLLESGSAPSEQAVLVVEDDDALGRLVSRTFKNHGFTCERATNLQQAQVLLASLLPDVVVMDYHLPDGNSDEFLKKVQRQAPHAVSIVMTGDSDPKLAVEALSHGASAYVQKPFDPVYLLELSERARRERALLRVESILQERTQELRESECRSRELLKGIPDGILLYNERGDILACNGVLLEWLGTDRDGIHECNVQQILAAKEPARFTTHIKDLAGKRRRITERCLVTRSGEHIPTEVCERVVPWRGEDVILSVHRDLRERRREEKKRAEIENHLRQQQKLESLGALAGGVAHEINNPINGIMNYAQLILDRESTDAKGGGYAEAIIEQTQRVAAIVRNLLSFARQDREATGHCHVAEAVAAATSLVHVLIRRDQTELVVSLPERLPPVACPSQRLQQVLVNLLTNARDAVNELYEGFDEKKRIGVTARHVGGDTPSMVRISIQDSGAGIPEGVSRRVFDPFFTTKPAGEGTGLGLSISHGIVKDCGGEIVFETPDGGGTVVHVDMPVFQGPEAKT